MTTMTQRPQTQARTITDRELLGLEHEFWTALKDRDGKTAGRLTARDSTVVGASGVSGIDPQGMGKLTQTAPYRIRDYRIDQQSMRVTHLADDVAAISYKVTEDLEVEGKPVKLDAFDSSIWKRGDTGWTCVLHTESIAGDPYGRDRVKDSRFS